MLYLRIKMRLGGCATCSENDDADTGGGVVRSFDPGSVRRGLDAQASMCVEAVSTAYDSPLALWVVEKLFIGYRDVYNGFEDTLGVGWV
jgi:hypothetical protein